MFKKLQKKKKPITKSGVNKTPPPNIPSVAISADSIGGDNYRNNNCLEFNVTATQNLHTQIKLIPLLPQASYHISIYDSSNNKNIIYSGKTSAPYSYFGRIGQGGVTRWRIIQREMLAKKIKKVTVKIC